MRPSDARLFLTGDPGALIFEGDANLVGELFRGLTFPEEDSFGCYSTFEVRDDAREIIGTERKQLITIFFLSETTGDPENDAWIAEERAELEKSVSGYQFVEGPLTITCLWYWDGDGTLIFHVRDSHQQRLLANHDCKKDYVWEDEPLPGASADDFAAL